MIYNKQGKVTSFFIALDVIGFAFVFLGAALIRFSREEVTAILGGFVLAGGVTLLSITRLCQNEAGGPSGQIPATCSLRSPPAHFEHTEIPPVFSPLVINQ